MMQRKVIVGLLLVGLGGGFHLAFSQLSIQLKERGLIEEARRVDELAPLPTQEEEKLPAIIAVETASPERFESAPPLLKGRESLTLLTPEEELPFVRPFQFQAPEPLVAAVDFWRKVYGAYDSWQVIFHDREDLSQIYSVLDLRYLRREGISEGEKGEIVDRYSQREKERLEAILTSSQAERLRFQIGLKDKFAQAVRISGRYLPLFEEIFESYGLPKELTRLVFVESLFQPRAGSKVGAKGFWQLMPGTGRRFLTINRLIDERYDPFLSTHAAARYLLENYEALGAWPLAITAYNTGVGHVRSGVRMTGSSDIVTLLTQYKSNSFGFASRNFYPEFLAALSVYENADRYFGEVEKENPWRFEPVTLPVSASFPQMAYLCDCSVESLAELNPSYAKSVYQGDYILSAGTEIRLPQGRANQFAVRFIEHRQTGQVLPASYAKNP